VERGRRQRAAQASSGPEEEELHQVLQQQITDAQPRQVNYIEIWSIEDYEKVSHEADDTFLDGEWEY